MQSTPVTFKTLGNAISEVSVVLNFRGACLEESLVLTKLLEQGHRLS